MADRRPSVEECQSETLSQLCHSRSDGYRRSRGRSRSRHHLQCRFHRRHLRRQLLQREFITLHFPPLKAVVVNLVVSAVFEVVADDADFVVRAAFKIDVDFMVSAVFEVVVADVDNVVSAVFEVVVVDAF